MTSKLTNAYIFRALYNTQDPRYRTTLGSAITNAMLDKINAETATEVRKLLNQMQITCNFSNSIAKWAPAQLSEFKSQLERMKPKFVEWHRLWDKLEIVSAFPSGCPKNTDYQSVSTAMNNLYSKLSWLDELTELEPLYEKVKPIKDGMKGIDFPGIQTEGISFSSPYFVNINRNILNELINRESMYHNWIKLVKDTPGAYVINACMNPKKIQMVVNSSGTKKTFEIPDFTEDIDYLQKAHDIIVNLNQKLQSVFETLPKQSSIANAQWLLQNAINARDHEEEWTAEAERQKKEAEEAAKEKEENDKFTNKVIVIVVISVVAIIVFLMLFFIFKKKPATTMPMMNMMMPMQQPMNYGYQQPMNYGYEQQMYQQPMNYGYEQQMPTNMSYGMQPL